MRISDLSRSTGVPIPTIKFYLREGILPPGTRTAPNQATYDADHGRRLRLVRVLVEVGGLSVAAVRAVVRALDDPNVALHDALAAAHSGLRRDVAGAGATYAGERTETDAWLRDIGWEVAHDSAGRDDLAATLAGLRGLGWEVGPEVFERYARAADTVAAEEVAYVAAQPDRQAAVEATVIGTVLFERALTALRRLAEERHSAARLGTAATGRAGEAEVGSTARASRRTSSPSRSRH